MFLMAAVSPAAAQQITGTPGSPSATTTIDGKTLPPLLGGALKPGKHTIVFDFKYDGPGLGKAGTGVLSVDGKQLARQTIPHTIPIIMTVDETFDVGIDSRTPVDNSYKLPFRFTGTIDKLTFKLGPPQLAEEDQRKIREALVRARD